MSIPRNKVGDFQPLHANTTHINHMYMYNYTTMSTSFQKLEHVIQSRPYVHKGAYNKIKSIIDKYGCGVG